MDRERPREIFASGRPLQPADRPELQGIWPGHYGSFRDVPFRGHQARRLPQPGYDNWMRPPHVHFSVYAAGVMHRLITQMYFPASR
ncbi:hypothetical protein I6G47_33685 (plasmid) [Delftia lacustris]|uniref:Intradiol ring-cleavage dioxygenases domain-containing protein n=1 Tax=Delftia lacustris TaxID=558537 RepID=A0A7T2Z0A9_9BURK|nr:hypothetical protein I6G47_33685 [Delftia lacustris]